MQQKSIMDLSFDEVMNHIQSKYDIYVESVNIGSRELKILQIKNLEDYVLKNVERLLSKEETNFIDNEKLLEIMELQWWTKIWEPSFVLALFMEKIQPKEGQKVLEIGAGMGIVGIYSALCGHDVTISDISEDALLFSRANAILNNLPHLPIVYLDWRVPYIDRPFEMIIGSEVVYDRRSYQIMIDFLDQALAPGGTIILAKNKDLKTPMFFELLVKKFKFKEKIVKMSSDDGSMEVVLYAIRRKGE